MEKPPPIKNDKEYEEAIRLADLIIDGKSGSETLKGIELEELLYSIKLYEEKNAE